MNTKMARLIYLFICFVLCLSNIVFAAVPANLVFDKYHQPDEITALLRSWSYEYPDLTKLIVIGPSAGEGELMVLRIAGKPEGSVEPDSRPAVFVSANIEGVHLVGTEAALMLIEKLLTQYGSDEKITSILENKTVYVAPLLNPDAAKNYFSKPRYARYTNNDPIDDDLDGLIDEDGPEDINHDGLITQMRFKDPGGKWIPDSEEPRIMRKANPAKGESGIYKIYTEGRDNDGDGRYNEDPPGGIELNRNFPFMLKHSLLKADQLPLPAAETIAIAKFLFDHPNIALVLNFSRENNLLHEDVVAGFSGTDESFGFDPQDMLFLKAIQKDYNEKLKETKRFHSAIKTEGIQKGSLIAFCYFQFGAPVISSDLWTIPESGKETNGQKNPDYSILKWSDETLVGKGFVEWTPFKHPDLGEVEIGGFVPFLKINPRPENIKNTILFHSEFYIDLIDHLAELRIKEIKVNPIGNALYKVTIYFTNPGWFPTSIAQGRKAGTSPPITVRIRVAKDHKIYSGEPFKVIPFIGGRGDVKSMQWTIKGKIGSQIILRADSPKAGSVKTIITLK